MKPYNIFNSIIKMITKHRIFSFSLQASEKQIQIVSCFLTFSYVITWKVQQKRGSVASVLGNNGNILWNILYPASVKTSVKLIPD